MINQRLDVSSDITDESARQPRLTPLNVVIGIAMSLLLHGLLAAWVWNMKLQSNDHTGTATSRPIEIQLRHELPPPAPPIVQTSENPESKKTPKPLVRAPRLAPTTPPLQAIAKTPSPPLPATIAPDSPVEKHLDLAAIHANLGAVVADVDREKRDTPVGQLQAKPLYSDDDDNKVGKAIRNTARSDCRDHIANTGLLAPLFLLAMVADKKDSGCKW
jgi:hypothetical protein